MSRQSVYVDADRLIAGGPGNRSNDCTVEERGNNLGTIAPKHWENEEVGPSRKQDESTT